MDVVDLGDQFEGGAPPTTLLEHLQGAAPRLAGHLDRIGYVRLESYLRFVSDQNYLRPIDPAATADALGAGRAALVVDLSHEGVRYDRRAPEKLAKIAAELRLDAGRIWLCQTNERFARDLAADAHASPGAKSIRLPYYNHFAALLFQHAEQRNWPAQALERLRKRRRQRPLKALCLNGAARQHRLVAIHELLRRIPRDRLFLTLSGLDGPKVNLEDVERSIGGFTKGALLGEHVISGLRAITFNEDKFHGRGSHQLAMSVDPDVYADTAFSIVTETEMTLGAVRRITEKSLKPLLFGQPFVVLGNPGVLAQLRAWGFDVFDDVIDPAYDEVGAPFERLKAAVATAEAFLQREARSPFLDDDGLRSRAEANIDRFRGAAMKDLAARVDADLLAAAQSLSSATAC